MINFDKIYFEIETILQEQNELLLIEFVSIKKNKTPKEIYLWCSENLKSVNHEKLLDVLRDFYYSVR